MFYLVYYCLVFMFLIQYGSSHRYKHPFGIKMCEDLCRHSKDCVNFTFATYSFVCSLDHMRVDCHQSVLVFNITESSTFGALKGVDGNCQKGSRIFQARSGRLRCENEIPRCNSFSKLQKSCKDGKLLEVQSIPSQRLEEITCMGYNHRTSTFREMCKGQVKLYDFLPRQGCYLKEKEGVTTFVMFLAVTDGGVKIVRKLSDEEKRSMKYTRKQDTIPVLSSIEHRKKDVFDFLMSRKCNLTSESNNIRKANILHWACSVGSVDMVNYILTIGSISIESKDVHGRTAILKAVFHGYIDIVKMLMKRCCNMSVVDNNKENVLFHACKGGHLGMIKYILSQDVVNKEDRDKHGYTALLLVTRFGNKEITELLISHGCNAKAVAAHGDNILHFASRRNKLEMVKYILSKGLVDIDSRGYRGQTAIFVAAYNGHSNMFMFLESKGCNLKLLDIYHENILHAACQGRWKSLVKYIVSKNIVNIDQNGMYGRTPIMNAIQSDSLPIVKLLVSNGCSLRKEDSFGNTVAHVACKKGNVSIVKYLLTLQNLDWKEKNNKGQSPVDLAKPNIRDIIREA